jgi:DNA-binding transcriptional MerR regulator
VGTYTIGEVAERSGFSASALRYYEGIGLVEPSARTGGGYRLYDDGALSRLAFISRAKHLGCSLEEITDLVEIWDGERCGPVQRRFHELITAKIAAAQRQLEELTQLKVQLEDAASLLAGPATDGPCGPGCACLQLADGGPVGVVGLLLPVPALGGRRAGARGAASPQGADHVRSRPVNAIPIHDDSSPLTCTATDRELHERIETIERLHEHLVGVDRTEHGLVLHFPHREDLETEVRRFAVDEKGCCRFWGFAVDVDDDGLHLRWDGPPAVRELMDRLHAYFEGDEPVTAVDGLL